MKVKLLSLAFALIYIPFSLFLTYLMLSKIEASELMWFLFWLTVPLGIVTATLQKLAEWEDD